jgi:hypothetical protein
VRIERTQTERVGRRRRWRRRRSGLHITLPLHTIAHLFTAPDLASALRAEGWRGRNETTLELPSEEVTPSLERETRDAVGRYCRSTIADLELELLRIRRHGLRTLLFGIVAVIVLNLAAGPISDTGDPLVEALSQGLQVASWVTLWLPINLLVYDRWYHRRDADLYRAILDMKLTIVPDRAPRPERVARSTAP